MARKQGKILGLAAASARMQVDPFPREEHLVEIVPSGADLGMYEDVPTGDPDSTLRVTNRFIDLPAGEFPPEDEARRFAEEKRIELVAARQDGDDDVIKAAVMSAKRANFTVTNARTAKGGVVNVRVQAMRVGSTVLIGLPLEPFAEFAAEMRQLSPAPAHPALPGIATDCWDTCPPSPRTRRAAMKLATPRCGPALAKRQCGPAPK